MTPNRIFPALLSLFFFAVTLASCQDHHWKPYDEVGPLPAPEKTFQGDIVSGTVELGESVKGKDYKGWWVFVIVRSKEGATMLAASRELVSQFPIPFAVTTKNIMVGKAKPGELYVLEAILDKDGIADTKEGDPIIGRFTDPIEAGHSNARLVLNTEKRS
jgi:hypothetical protein